MSPGPSGARRVFVHIGLPKTGTTYLQRVVWGNRDRLRSDGVFLPGFGHREHLWAALDLQERPKLAKRHESAPGSWDRLVRESLAPQKNSWVSSTVDLDSVMEGASAGGPEFSMRTWDLAGVLERWTPALPSERVHVLVMPGSGQPRDLHWRHFAEVLGVDPAAYELPDDAVNPALGIVQIELLRRVNAQLPAYSARDRGVWIRGYLAEDLLASQPRERGGLPTRHAERFAELDRAATDLVTERGFHVLGDLADLAPDETPAASGRAPGAVTAEELLESASRLVADIVADVRASTGDVPPRIRGSL